MYLSINQNNKNSGCDKTGEVPRNISSVLGNKAVSDCRVRFGLKVSKGNFTFRINFQ